MSNNENSVNRTAEGAPVHSLLANRMLLRIIAFAVSVILLVLAFCPLAYSDIKAGGKTYKVEYSAADSIVYAVSMFRFEKNSKLKNTDLYKEIAESEFINSIIPVSEDEGERLLSGMIKLSLMNTSNFIVGVLISAIAGILYILLALLLLVFSSIALAREFLATMREEHDSGNSFDKATVVLWLVAAMFPFFAYGFYQLSGYAQSELFGIDRCGSNGIGWGLILGWIVSLGGALFLACSHAIMLIKRKGVNAKIKKAFVSLALLAVITVSVALPALTVDMAAESQNGNYSSQAVYLSALDIFEINTAEIRQYSKVSPANSYENIYRTAEQIVFDEAENKRVELDIISTAVIGINRFDVSIIYVIYVSVTAVMLLIVAIASCLILCRNLLSKSTDKAERVMKIIASVCAIAFFAVNATLFGFAFSVLSYRDISAILNFKLGAGPLVILASAILMFFTVRTKEVKMIDFDYDNADVSYAPYVVGTEKFKP
jgi:hypothetical protein